MTSIRRKQTDALADMILAQWTELRKSKAILEFFRGLGVSLQALSAAVLHPSIRQCYAHRIQNILAFAIMLVLLSKCMVFPIRVLIWFVNLFFSTQASLATVDQCILQIGKAVPLGMLVLFRYFGSDFFERIFFNTLRLSDPEFAVQLQHKSHHWIRSAIKRYVRYLYLSLAVGLLSLLVPIALPILSIYRFGRQFGHVNWFLFLLLLALYVIPSTRFVSIFMINSWIEARCFLREVLDPFLGRDRRLHFSTVFRQKEAFLLGFYLPFALASRNDWLRPFLWILGSSAAGRLTHEFVKEHFKS